MVARFFRLRLALLLVPFRAVSHRVAGAVLAGVVLLAAAFVLAALPVWMFPQPEVRASIDVVIVGIMVLAAGVVPLFANRRHLEPRQFGQYPVSAGRIALALLTSTVLTWPVLWLFAWGAAWLTLRSGAFTAWWAVAVVGVLFFALVIVSARVASGLAKLCVPESLQPTLRMVGFFLLIAMLPAGVFAVAQMVLDPQHQAATDVSGVLQWTPLGAPMAMLLRASAGDVPAALVHGAIGFGWVLLLVACWALVVSRSLEHAPRPQEPAVARRTMGFFGRFSSRPSAVIGARALTYWLRDPRYRVGVAAVPVAVALMVLALMVAGVEPQVLALLPLPLMLLLLGWSLHNDIAMDSTAIWIHVVSGIRGRDDRWGRLAPMAAIGLPLVLVGSSISVTVAGDWRILPAVVGVNLAVLCVSSGVSSVFSVLFPYATTRPGDSPFTQPTSAGSASGFSPGLSMFVSLLFSIPPVLIALPAFTAVEFGSNLLAFWACTAYGVVVLAAGVLIGGRVFDRTAPNLVALTQSFD